MACFARTVLFSVAVISANDLPTLLADHPPAIAEKMPVGEPVAPVKTFQRGDYAIEVHHLGLNDLVKFKPRGVYRVAGVQKDRLLLKPMPRQNGLLPGIWSVPLGRVPIGNHHKIVVSELDPKRQRAKISLEYKTRFHWWDLNF